MYQFLFPLKAWAKRWALSERDLSQEIGLSRISLRSLYKKGSNFTVASLLKVAPFFGQSFSIVSHGEGNIDSSTLGVSYKITQDGFDSWKIHLMNMVDEFRATLDMRILFLPPTKDSDTRIQALIASVVLQLCSEVEVEAPLWAKESYFLPEPWFISGMDSLKAFALLESPLAFRRNNIFVLDDFLKRA